MQMGNRLAHGKSGLVQVERTLEQQGQQLKGAARLLRTGLHHLKQPLCMVIVQLLNARMQAGKRFAMGRQSERLGRQRPELVN